MSTVRVNEVRHLSNSGASPNISLDSTGNSTVQSLTASGTVSANTVVSTGSVTGASLISNIAVGTAPLTVTSTTKVSNLNVDKLNGKTHGSTDGDIPVLSTDGTANTISLDLLGKTIPSGSLVGTSDTQSLSNKTFTTSTEIQGLLTVTGASAEIRCAGDVTAYYTSDIRKKRNVRMISSNPLADLAVLRGVRFEWLEDHPTGGESSVGVIAQEVQPVVPEAVIQRPDGTLAVRYELLIPLLIESVNQLSKQVQELQRAME